MGIKEKNITVFGFGRSGIASAKRLSALGKNVILTEVKNEEMFESKTVEEMRALGVALEFGGHTEQAIAQAELIVVSPGIHLDIPRLEEAKKKNKRRGI